MERWFRALISQQIRIGEMRKAHLANVSEAKQAAEFAFEMDSAFGRTYWDISKDYLPFTDSFKAEVDRNLSSEHSSRIEMYRAELEKREQKE